MNKEITEVKEAFQGFINDGELKPLLRAKIILEKTHPEMKLQLVESLNTGVCTIKVGSTRRLEVY